MRQGCPLSPLLFVLAIDILLRRLQRMFPSSVARAFADDNAMVVWDFGKEGNAILKVYRDFACFSGLTLNIAKTIVIPLSECCLDDVKKTLIADAMPEWDDAMFAYAATYLGFEVGTKRNSVIWKKALD